MSEQFAEVIQGYLTLVRGSILPEYIQHKLELYIQGELEDLLAKKYKSDQALTIAYNKAYSAFLYELQSFKDRGVINGKKYFSQYNEG